jgi:hypothetical protein
MTTRSATQLSQSAPLPPSALTRPPKKHSHHPSPLRGKSFKVSHRHHYHHYCQPKRSHDRSTQLREREDVRFVKTVLETSLLVYVSYMVLQKIFTTLF